MSLCSEATSSVVVGETACSQQNMVSLNVFCDNQFTGEVFSDKVTVNAIPLYSNLVSSMVVDHPVAFANDVVVEQHPITVQTNTTSAVLVIPDSVNTVYPHVLRFYKGLLETYNRFDLDIWVDTTQPGSSNANQFDLPLVFGGTYNFIAYWGDGTNDTFTTYNPVYRKHTFTGGPGLYNIKLVGQIKGWAFYGVGDCKKLMSVENWDVGFQMWSELDGYYFSGCVNMQLNVTTPPNLSETTGLRAAFYDCAIMGSPDLSNWDTSLITNMNYTFFGTNFNGNITTWNTGAVTEMEYTFGSTTEFDQDLRGWDVSNVTSMYGMFADSKKFNQSLNTWDVARVQYFGNMFTMTEKFNGAIDAWDTGSATSFHSMFQYAKEFNQPLNNWDTSRVLDMSYMFSHAEAFNQPLDKWNTGLVETLESMFEYSVFNQNINSWNVINVKTTINMFESNSVFNQPLNRWNVSNVTIMDNMFTNTTAFNQPLYNWNVEKVTSMVSLFYGAWAFKQDLSNWNPKACTDMGGMFYGTNMNSDPSTGNNYTKLLLSWGSPPKVLGLQDSVSFDAGNSQYQNSALVLQARDTLLNFKSWSITDGGPVV